MPVWGRKQAFRTNPLSVAWNSNGREMLSDPLEAD